MLSSFFPNATNPIPSHIAIGLVAFGDLLVILDFTSRLVFWLLATEFERKRPLPKQSLSPAWLAFLQPSQPKWASCSPENSIPQRRTPSIGHSVQEDDVLKFNFRFLVRSPSGGGVMNSASDLQGETDARDSRDAIENLHAQRIFFQLVLKRSA